MNNENIQCPVCLYSDKLRCIKKHKEYSLYKCPQCDVEFSNPMKNPGSEWYAESELYDIGKIIDSGVGWNHKQFLRHKICGVTLLDIGCGTGAFLSHASKLGYLPCGIDFDEIALRVAKERYKLQELHSINVSDLKVLFPSRKFNVVTFFEVLEHVEDPIEFMRQVKEVVADSGLIALSLPNRDRYLDFMGENDGPPNHLTRWTINALSEFINQQGFDVIEIYPKPMDISEIIAFLHSKVRLGLARSLVKSGNRSGDNFAVQKGRMLLKIKNAVFFLIAILFLPLIFIFRPQGSTIFCMARKK